jgi:hypothetical protein
MSTKCADSKSPEHCNMTTKDTVCGMTSALTACQSVHVLDHVMFETLERERRVAIRRPFLHCHRVHVIVALKAGLRTSGLKRQRGIHTRRVQSRVFERNSSINIFIHPHEKR